MKIVKIRYNVIYSVFILLVLVSSQTSAKLLENPHNKMECGSCHAVDVSFDKPLIKLELVDDQVVNLCLKCHSDIMNAHHPQRVQITGEIPDYLPVGEGNFIICTTCHNIHQEDASMHFLRSASIGNYKSRIDICYDCHKENFKSISPHKSEEEGLSCLTCHTSAPTSKDTIETVNFVTENIEKMCDFCHNIDNEKHPTSVDKTIDLSPTLPRSKDKKVVCITCHDPHGTINTINFLREKYVSDLEFGKYEKPHSEEGYFNCLKCHAKPPSEKEYTGCKYEDDFILLCYNCHGVDAEKCHPVNVELSKDMTLPAGFKLNNDNLITCVTCHNPDCTGDSSIRYRNFKQLAEESCNDCHNFAGLKGVNPHQGKENKITCAYCHDRDKQIEDFGMSEKFLCLRCHKYKKHPASVDHLARPKSTMVLIPQVRLNRKGKIKCSTCHDPHMDDTNFNKLRKFENITNCEACHQI